MDSRLKLLLLILNLSMIMNSSQQFLDTEPLEGLKGEVTDRATHGWKISLNHLLRSYSNTKYYQERRKSAEPVVNTILSQPTKTISRGYSSPKRYSKCIYGTPNPIYNCGPDISGRILVKEWQELSDTMWKLYLFNHGNQF